MDKLDSFDYETKTKIDSMFFTGKIRQDLIRYSALKSIVECKHIDLSVRAMAVRKYNMAQGMNILASDESLVINFIKIFE